MLEFFYMSLSISFWLIMPNIMKKVHVSYAKTIRRQLHTSTTTLSKPDQYTVHLILYDKKEYVMPEL